MPTSSIPGAGSAPKKESSTVKRNRYSPPDVPSLLSSLHAVQSRQKKLIHSTIHTYTPGGFQCQPEDGGHAEQPVASSSKQAESNEKYHLTSWKMSEHHYRRKDCPFPVLARGLFTANKEYSLPQADAPQEEEKDGSRIVARGYDKFFNVGEVEWTKWAALEKHTSPPYSLTYKSNGCLILLSALNERELFVSSKHSAGTSTVTVPTGTVDDADGQNKAETSGDVRAANANSSKAEPSLSEGMSNLQLNGSSISSKPAYPEKHADKLDSFPRTADDPTSPPAEHIEADTQADGTAPAYFADQPSGQVPVQGPGEVGKSKPAVLPNGRDPNSKSQQKRDKKKAEAAEKKAKATKAAEDAKKNREAFDKQMQEDADEENGGRSGGHSHAGMGRKWLKIHLDRAGRTEEELASELWKRGLTCVFELCDDSFEEHVLATPEHMTGLHLHGLNENIPRFSTLSPNEVQIFATEWGFIPTASATLHTLAEVKKYTDKVAKEGKWNDEAIEGFVVRCKVKEGAADDGMEPPYPSGSPFFFKIKFDEPYLMYRTWREITRTLLPLTKSKLKGKFSKDQPPWTQLGGKLKRPENKVYAEWVAAEMLRNPDLFQHYETGIIRVREAFLSWTRSDGKQQWAEARKSSEILEVDPAQALPLRYLVVPVAIPGMGKTILGVALKQLLGGQNLSHQQSDDVKTKKTGPTFLKNVKASLKTHEIVFADRNNHLPKHHEELVDLINDKDLADFQFRKIALVYDIDHHPPNKVLRIASERVLNRGENHQSLRPDMADIARHELVIKKFQGDFVPPEGGLFDDEIKLSVTANLRENLQTAVDAIFSIIGRPKPDAHKLDEALAFALNYKPTVKKDIAGEPSKPPRYYALSVEFDLAETAGQILDNASESCAGGQEFLKNLLNRSRVITKPHITIVHEKTVAAEAQSGKEFEAGATPVKALWDACKTVSGLPKQTRFEFDVTGLLWNDKVMTFVIEGVKPNPGNQEGGNGEDIRQVDNALCRELTDVVHVTVGTKDESIAPVEAKGLLARWKAGTPEAGENIGYVKAEKLTSTGRVLGLN